MRAKGHIFCLRSEKTPIKEGETGFCQIGQCLPTQTMPLACSMYTVENLDGRNRAIQIENR